jgi:mannose-1-phosphate guanylyltransferase/mannose-6-phosphate isomerase
MGRNTLPAVLLGLEPVVAADPEAVVAVFPADHSVKDVAGWRAAMDRAVPLAEEGWFVTFGVPPRHAETGYGYIHRGTALGEGAWRVEGFTEKPDLATAESFLASGEYFWNSGMFVFRADVFLAAVAEHAPACHAWWQARDRRPLAEGYSGLPDVSVDYGVVEHLSRIAMVEAAFDWDDLGSFEAIYRLGHKDESGCVIQGDVLALDCEGSLLVSRGSSLAAVGLRDSIVIQTRDATLVCPMAEAQRVKDVVGALRAKGSRLVEAHTTVRRPWGSYTVLEDGPGYKIKRIEVPPAGKLSLQMHHHRTEHWVVVAGTAQVQVGENELLLTENQSVDIPKATVHRLANPGKVPVEIIEIQTGPYLEEDDIVRFDDIYGRKVGSFGT